MIPLLTLLSLAASVCPPQAAGFTFASLMSIYNAAGQLSSIVGAHYTNGCSIRRSAADLGRCVYHLGAYLIVPFLPDTDRQ